MQSKIVCSGCRDVLVYPRGATNVCCASCNSVTPVPPPQVPPPGMDMALLLCGGCLRRLMYTRGAMSVRCSCSHTVNLAPVSNVVHVNCGNCRTTLMYTYGAPSVKCAVCQYITNMRNARVLIPMHPPSGTITPAFMPPTSTTQTVAVENPISVDKSGKLVSNVVVGVTTEKKMTQQR